MADCSNEFSEFHETIKLTATKRQSLRHSRDAIRDRIKAHFGDDMETEAPSFRGQGSYAMATIVNPISGEFDIDDGVYLKNLDTDKTKWPTTATVHNWIYKAVDGQTNEKPTDKNKCIRVVYAGQYHVDLPIYGLYNDLVYLAVKDDGWTVSDPQAITDWFLESAKNHGDQLRRIVRYIKAWADYKSGSLPSGLVLTVLVVDNFSGAESDDVSFADTIKKIQAQLAVSSVIYNPVDAGELLSDGVSETQLGNLKNGLSVLASTASKALADPDVVTACERWKKVFGDRFPNASAAKSEAIYASAPAVISGGAPPWAH